MNYKTNSKFIENLQKKLLDSIPSIIEKNIKNLNINNFTNEIVEALIKTLIKIDFEIFMGYEKYSRDTKSNYRNGLHKRKLFTPVGEINLDIPHDRNCSFFPEIINKHERRTDEITSMILNLFTKGLSNKEIVDFVDDVYGKKYSRQTISLISEVTNEVVKQFKQKKLKKEYKAIFMDATYVPIKFGNKFEKQALHLVVGINEHGYQEILGFSIGFTENTAHWADVLNDLKIRGVEKVGLFIVDGFIGLDKVIKIRFPNSLIQKCTIHALRNLKRRIKVGDKTSLINDVKKLVWSSKFRNHKIRTRKTFK